MTEAYLIFIEMIPQSSYYLIVPKDKLHGINVDKINGKYVNYDAGGTDNERQIMTLMEQSNNLNPANELLPYKNIDIPDGWIITKVIKTGIVL